MCQPATSPTVQSPMTCQALEARLGMTTAGILALGPKSEFLGKYPPRPKQAYNSGKG